jgi:hypothetical protein
VGGSAVADDPSSPFSSSPDDVTTATVPPAGEIDVPPRDDEIAPGTSLGPENIHLNSFMYEPIVDMSDAHLRDLYRRVKALV